MNSPLIQEIYATEDTEITEENKEKKDVGIKTVRLRMIRRRRS
jgi:hypothetical protein